MEFRFTEEQAMIRETAAAFIDETVTSEHVRAAMVTESGYDPTFWQMLTGELYWQALPIAEELGGLGLGFVELVALLEQMGRRLTCSPFFSSVCLSLMAAKQAPSSAVADAIQNALLEGQTVAFVHTGKNGGYRVKDVGIDAHVVDGKMVLDGIASHVLHGNSSDFLLVCARENNGIGLFFLPANSQGISTELQPSMDQTRRLAKVEFSQVEVSEDCRLCDPNQGSEIVSATLNLAMIAAAAEMVGGAQHALDSSVDYIKERVQFGRSIASFQAVKHKCADVMLKVESARSALYWAACMANEFLEGRCDENALIEAASTANCYASEAFFFAAGTGIQLHGGVGITSEYDIQLYFKRARALEAYLGTPSWHRERIAALILGGGE